jgi:2-oxoisovalerate dehydrogenase E1 component
MPSSVTKEKKNNTTTSAQDATLDLDRDSLLKLYEQMFLLRQSELAAQQAYKKGEMPGFIHLYVGQEAVAVGLCAHLRNDDWITSTHRGHGHALAKGMPVRSLLAELFAKATGCCGGRGGSMHLYDREHGVFGTNGIVGAGIPHAVGAAMSAQVRGTDGIAAAFFGDGATSHGAFHEALNFAGAQRAGVLFVCENNLYATATPLTQATRNPDIAGRAAAYGIEGVSVDGNDVLAVWKVGQESVARARRGEGPTLIEAKTYRQVGHHEGDPLVGTYRTQEELDFWIQRDPIVAFRKQLIEKLKIATQEDINALEAMVNATVTDALEFARNSPEPDLATTSLHSWSEDINSGTPVTEVGQPTVIQGWLEAVRDGIAEEMRRDPHVLYFGEGTGERGGSFAHTKGLWQEFGPARLVDTPICELGFTGAAIGASATGCRTIADLMFVDFLFETGGQIPLQASKLRYMSNGQMTCPVIIRAPCGAIKSAGPHHSGTYHAMWSHLPGLIVAMPSNPADAKGLMKTALRGNDPVLFLEPKALFSSKGAVPTGEHFVPFGVARVARQGTDLTLVAAGRMVPLALEAAELADKKGISCEVIDLRTIVPLDVDTIMTSLTKTHRLLVVDEGYAMCGIGGEVAAAVSELAFDELDAPVGRLHLEPVSHPFSPRLEAAILPNVEKIVAAALELMAGRIPVSSRPHSKRSTPLTAQVKTPAPADPVMPPTQAEVPAPMPPEAEGTGDVEIMPGELVTMPHGDLTVSEAKVVFWRKQIGDAVTKGEAIAEVETEKTVMEIEAPKDGKLVQILADVGTIVKMGGNLGVVS